MKEGIVPPNFYSCMLTTSIYAYHILSLPRATYTAGNIELGWYFGCAGPGWYFGYAESGWCLVKQLVKDHDVHSSLQIISEVLGNYIGLQAQIKSMAKTKTSDKISAVTFGNATQTTTNSSYFFYLWDKIKVFEQLRSKAPPILLMVCCPRKTPSLTIFSMFLFSLSCLLQVQHCPGINL